MIPVEKLSPMMEQYRGIKSEYPDCILMYRLGDFYEMFFDDALEASQILELTLTSRDCGLEERAPMCGVPYHAVDSYVAKLIANGKKVAICEQLTAPTKGGGMLKRDVVRVITGGTVTDEEVLPPKENNYLLAIAVDNATCGIAWGDISTGEVFVTQLPDKTQAEDFLLGIGPKEMIAPTKTATEINTCSAVVNGKLCKASQFYDIAFMHKEACICICAFYKLQDVTGLGMDDLSTGICALGGLLQYIRSTQKRTLQHIAFPKVLRPSGVMYLDYATRRNLELTETLNGQGTVGSLLWVLDRTNTNMGARLLRKWLLEPLLKADDIRARLQAVEVLTTPKLRAELNAEMRTVRDLERLGSKIAYNTVTPKDCLAIAETLGKIPPIQKLLGGLKNCPLLTRLNAELSDLAPLRELLEKAIYRAEQTGEEEGEEKKVYLIAEGYNAQLDTYRNAKKSARKWIREYENQERLRTGIRNLKVGYNRVFGYYLEVSNSNLKLVPADYMRRQTLTNGERFITEDLKSTENSILDSEEKAHLLEAQLYQQIKDTLFAALASLQRNARALAQLDVLLSFAQTSVEHGYTKPKIEEKKRGILIVGGRHPVVEAIKRRNEFVPNDTLLDDECNTMIITGPNMAGKSTYMRQVALIVLLAHIGCFVPASRAEIHPVDRIFTRVGASDNLAFGQSTFMVEMSEVANILNNATENSLLILDEIGRGTSTLDGLSIAWAIIEQISLKIGAKTLFSTHYHELSDLERTIPKLKNYHVLINENKDGITFLYKVARGSASRSFGIEVAALAGVGKQVTNRAKAILQTLERTHEKEVGEQVGQTPGEDAVPVGQMGFFTEDERYKEVIGALQDIDLDSTTPLQAITFLKNLQAQVEQRKKGKK